MKLKIPGGLQDKTLLQMTAEDLRKSVKVSFLSMVGKYLPGKVWLVLGKVYLSLPG